MIVSDWHLSNYSVNLNKGLLFIKSMKVLIFSADTFEFDLGSLIYKAWSESKPYEMMVGCERFELSTN